MHESSLARQVLEAVVSRTPEANRVRVIRGWLAETEALDRGAIEFHFGVLAQGTVAEGAKLELELIHTEARCLECGQVYKPEHHLTLCPECGSTEGELLGETGFGVDSIDVE